MKNNYQRLIKILIYLQIIILIFILPVFLSIFKLQTVLKWITPKKIKKTNNSDKIIKFVKYIFSKNIFFFKQTCLIRSMVLYHFLSREQNDLKINFGIRKNNNGVMEGHCWLTKSNELYLEIVNPEKIYTTMLIYP